ncbi:MAG TPA: hypothetical protein VK842_10600, partial [bacterium]|nr:hypothetical protein [bacterium]
MKPTRPNHPWPFVAALAGLACLAACGKSGDSDADQAVAYAPPAHAAAPAQAPAGRLPAYGPTKFNVPIAQLDAVRLCIGAVGTGQLVDTAHFPRPSRFQDPRTIDKVASPDGHFTVWRQVDKDGYWLFLSSGKGKPKRLDECKNGYQPIWSPDSKQILYSAMDWRLEERNLFIYDLA